MSYIKNSRCMMTEVGTLFSLVLVAGVLLSATVIFDRLSGVWTVILTVTEVNSLSKLSLMLCSKSFGLIGSHIWGEGGGVGGHIRVLVFGGFNVGMFVGWG